MRIFSKWLSKRISGSISELLSWGIAGQDHERIPWGISQRIHGAAFETGDARFFNFFFISVETSSGAISKTIPE